jgi:hypothetical protein
LLPCTPAPQPPLPAPALDIYRHVTGRYPPKGAEPLILEAGITTEPDRQRWERVIRCYIGCGWNPRNIQGMLDYYRRGELPGRRQDSPRGGVSLNRTTVGLQPYRVATPDMFTMRGGFE